METKEFIIPEGWEIDKENSTNEKIVLKEAEKKRFIDCETAHIEGYFIGMQSDIIPMETALNNKHNYNIFATEKQAKSALEEIKEPVITYGRDEYGRDGSQRGGSLGGWSNPENEQAKNGGEIGGCHFCFTIHFPSAKWEEHDKFMKGRILRGLMDRLQHEADSYFTQFVENFTEEM